ncbi:MAG: transglutaminase domain-containing protein [Planctomycetota bacterium]
MRLLFVLLLGCFAAPLPAGSEETAGGSGEATPPYPRVYLIETQGKRLGYSIEKCEEGEAGNTKMKIYSTRTFLQAGTGGAAQPGSALSKFEYRVDAETGRVRSAYIEQYQGNAYELRSAEFFDYGVEILITRSVGAGAKETMALPPDAVVPYSPAAPALLLMNSGQNEARFPFLDLVTGKLETVTARAKGEETLESEGKSYACRRVLVDWGDLYRESLLWVTGEGVMIKKEMPVQGLVFRLASEKTAARLIPQEKEPSPFIPVEAKIKNRSSLTFLMLRARLYCPSVTEASALTVANQTFDGRVEDGFIDGVFKIRSTYLDRTQAMDIPADPEEASGLAEYLRPAPSIESDHPSIMDTARDGVKALSNRWHAAHSLGMDVVKRVTYAPSVEGLGGSAAAALEKGRADALGLTRLHVALCRSLGIPARVVRGAVYSLVDDSAGFVEHAWSEIFLGDQGWVPMDVTAGALIYLDAGHLRLGLSAEFRPVEIEIMDYIPKPEANRPAAACMAAAFPMARGETHVYDYFINDQLWGTEKVTFRGEELHNGQPLFVFSSKVDLNTLKGNTLSKVRKEGGLVSYNADLGDVTCTCRAQGNEAHCRLCQGDSVQEKTVVLPVEGFFFDTHQIFQLGFLLSRLRLEPGEIIQISALQPAVMRTITLQVERQKDSTREINGRAGRVRVFDLLGNGQKMRVWLSPEGLLLEEKEMGGLTRVLWRGVE